MVNFNLNVQKVPFFDSVSNPLTSDQNSVSFAVNGFDNLAIEISGNGGGTFTVQGCVNTLGPDGQALDDDHISWTNLSVLNAFDFKQYGTMTANGIYYVAVAAISRIRISATSVSGNKTIVGAFTK